MACFNPQDDSPIHVGLKNEYLPFLTERYYNNSCHSNISYDNIEEDFDGYKHTYDIANAKDYVPELFKAIDYCINYESEGTEKGDWHLGATGEMIAIAKNLIFINAAIMLVGIGETLAIDWVWTSSQYRDGQDAFSWLVYLLDGSSLFCWYGRGGKVQVRPLLAFIKQA